MKLADLSFGQRHDRHIGKAHALEEACCVFLVAADSIKCLRIDQVEASASRMLQSNWIPGLISVAPDTARSL
jgi:hypothetical protein